MTNTSLNVGAHEILAYTIPDFCKAVGLGKTKVYEMIKQGRLKSAMLEGRRIVPATEARRIIEEAICASQ